MVAENVFARQRQRRPVIGAALLRVSHVAGLGVIGGVVRSVVGGLVLLTVAVALLAPWLAPYGAFDQDLLLRNQGPSALHLLGTDHLGRDVLSRLLVGTQISLTVGVGGTLLALAIGGGLGLIAVALGGWLRYLVFGAVDLLRAMPGILLALLLIVALGAGVVPVMVALGFTFAPIFAYVARASYIREAGSDYAAAAKAMGSGRLRILLHHILPNVVGAFVTQAAIILPRCIVSEAVLSFLGVGVAPDTPTWGRMIAQASRFFEINPIAVLAPVCVLSLLTLSIALLGDRLRLALDPLRQEARGCR